MEPLLKGVIGSLNTSKINLNNRNTVNYEINDRKLWTDNYSRGQEWGRILKGNYQDK
jgi:hypothetical protein